MMRSLSWRGYADARRCGEMKMVPEGEAGLCRY